LRINYIGGTLPTDRESVFWLNVKSIAHEKDEVNKLQVNIKSNLRFSIARMVWRASLTMHGAS
jgi:P pilus assembly chaperone PapD